MDELPTNFIELSVRLNHPPVIVTPAQSPDLQDMKDMKPGHPA